MILRSFPVCLPFLFSLIHLNCGGSSSMPSPEPETGGMYTAVSGDGVNFLDEAAIYTRSDSGATWSDFTPIEIFGLPDDVANIYEPNPLVYE